MTAVTQGHKWENRRLRIRDNCFLQIKTAAMIVPAMDPAIDSPFVTRRAAAAGRARARISQAVGVPYAQE